MAFMIQPSVEENISTLMNVVGKESWREEGLFDNMDSTVLGSDTFISPYEKPLLSPLTRSFLNPGPASSFVECLLNSLGFPQTTVRLKVAQSREEQIKEKN